MKEKNKQNQKATKARQESPFNKGAVSEADWGFLNSKFQLLNSNAAGITLIGLIITVIVMLILVAVTIDIAVDGKLFDKAEEAVSKTNDKTAQLQNGVDYWMDKLDEADKMNCTHSYENWTIIQEATCTVSGTRKAICTECGKETTEIISAIGHSYGEWVTTKEATCTEPGSKTKTCTKCGDKITEVIPNTGHTFTGGTCTDCGEREYDNNIPVISSVTLNSKTINSFTVDALATDSDGDTLTYSLYISGDTEAKDTTTGTSGNTVQLTASNLSEYTDYTYYVTVTDNVDNIETDEMTVKTKCSGQTITCATNDCTTGSTVACTKCSGTGKCTTCGGDGELTRLA